MDLTYERTENFDGEPAKAIEIARNTLLPHGFEIIRSDESYLEVVHKGFPWGNRPNPIKMISSANISVDNNEITLKAELGNIKKVLLFLIFFMIGMIAMFLVVFGITFVHQQGQPWSRIIKFSLLPFLPFPFVILFSVVWFKTNALKTLDTLMKNMLSVSQSAKSDRFVR